MRMQAALTQLGVSLALVTVAIMEMDSLVQVCDYVTIKTSSNYLVIAFLLYYRYQ